MPYNKDVVGWMQIGDLDVLEQLASSVPENGTIVEVGSLFGRSSVCLAMSARKSVRIQCIDRFPSNCCNTHGHSDEVCREHGWPLHNVVYDAAEEFRKNTKDYPNIEMIIGTAPDRIPNYQPPENIDLLFIDADHTNPGDWANLCYFVPKVRVGGIIAGHDYNSIFPDVVTNVARLETILETTATHGSCSTLWYMSMTKKIQNLE
jgi:predicted O-methyltransferase YrrM